MAQQALGPGTAVPRRRALFGLLDADGWGWATVKAFVWLIIIIFILGYLPDRAYYLTVGRTVDLGVLVWSPINLCPPSNETLPCPAPGGAVIPWEPSPPSWPCRRARTDGAAILMGSEILFFGGSDGKTAHPTPSTSLGRSATGNFDSWTEGPKLPAPRANASVVSVAGSIYVIGGADAANAPTDTVFVLSPNALTGALGDWTTSTVLKLPEARAGAAAAVTPDGLLLVGGRNATGPVATTWKTLLNNTGKLSAWSVEQPLVMPQTDATAALIGDYLWLYGGSNANGPVGAVQRGVFGKAGGRGPAGQSQSRASSSAGTSTTRPTCRSRGPMRRAGPPTGPSTWPAATTARAPRTRCTGPSRRTPVISRSGSTSTPWTCRHRASRAPPR